MNGIVVFLQKKKKNVLGRDETTHSPFAKKEDKRLERKKEMMTIASCALRHGQRGAERDTDELTDSLSDKKRQIDRQKDRKKTKMR